MSRRRTYGNYRDYTLTKKDKPKGFINDFRLVTEEFFNDNCQKVCQIYHKTRGITEEGAYKVTCRHRTYIAITDERHGIEAKIAGVGRRLRIAEAEVKRLSQKDKKDDIDEIDLDRAKKTLEQVRQELRDTRQKKIDLEEEFKQAYLCPFTESKPNEKTEEDIGENKDE